jgi:GNAT superfamily N-acetyltransferase
MTSKASSDFAAEQERQQPAAFRLRLATPVDIPRLLHLKWQMAIEDMTLASFRATEDDWRRDGFGPDARFTALVAEHDERIVGMLMYSERYYTGLDTADFYVQDIFVELSYRKHGVGSSLLAGLAARARERRITRIKLDVREDNNTARRLYRNLGFERLRDSVTTVLAGEALLDLAKTSRRVVIPGVLSSEASTASGSPVQRRTAEPIAVHVRSATPADIARFFELKRQLAVSDRTTPAMRLPEHDWRRDGFGLRPQFMALVAEDGTRTVGMLTYSECYYTALSQPIFYVQDLLVEPSHRRKSVASALLANLCAHAHERNIPLIEWNIKKHNTVRRCFSHDLGFNRVLHCVNYVLFGPALLDLSDTAISAGIWKLEAALKCRSCRKAATRRPST